jgi:hypothetical protein
MRTNLFVRVVLDGATWKVTNKNATSKMTFSDFWDNLFKTQWLELFPVSWSMSYTNYWVYDQGAWLYKGSTTVTDIGTGELGTAVRPCTVLNITLRDEDYKFARIQLGEPDILVPASSQHGETWQDLSDWIGEIVAGTDGGSTHIGDYITSRGGKRITSLINWGSKISDRMRRAQNFIR